MDDTRTQHTGATDMMTSKIDSDTPTGYHLHALPTRTAPWAIEYTRTNGQTQRVGLIYQRRVSLSHEGRPYFVWPLCTEGTIGQYETLEQAFKAFKAFERLPIQHLITLTK